MCKHFTCKINLHKQIKKLKNIILCCQSAGTSGFQFGVNSIYLVQTQGPFSHMWWIRESIPVLFTIVYTINTVGRVPSHLSCGVSSFHVQTSTTSPDGKDCPGVPKGRVGPLIQKPVNEDKGCEREIKYCFGSACPLHTSDLHVWLQGYAGMPSSVVFPECSFLLWLGEWHKFL